MPENNIAMTDFPNRKLKDAARCGQCDARMPAGSWVVPLRDGRALCSVSCVEEHIESEAGRAAVTPAGKRAEAEDLRREAEELQETALALDEEAHELEQDAKQRILDEDHAKHTRHITPPATFAGAEIPPARY